MPSLALAPDDEEVNVFADLMPLNANTSPELIGGEHGGLALQRDASGTVTQVPKATMTGPASVDFGPFADLVSTTSGLNGTSPVNRDFGVFTDLVPESPTSESEKALAETTMPFETRLAPAEEPLFQAWKNKVAPDDTGEDYDLRGAFKAGLAPDPVTKHWPDTFKKPNHPTFSTQSVYAKDRPDLAGEWNGDEFVPPLSQAEKVIAERFPNHGERWIRMQAEDARRAQAAGLPPTLNARKRLIDAIQRTEQAGFQVPHFIGKPGEPTGDRGVTRDAENLVAALKQQEASLLDGNERNAVAAQRAYWEELARNGMTAEEWQKRGFREVEYPHEADTSVLHQTLNAGKVFGSVAGKYIFHGLQGFELERAKRLRNPPSELTTPQAEDALLPQEKQDELEKLYIKEVQAGIPEAERNAEYWHQRAEDADEQSGVDPALANTIPARLAAAAGHATMMGIESLIPGAGVPVMVFHGALATEAEAKNAGKSDAEAEQAAVRSAIGLGIFGGASKGMALGMAKLIPEGSAKVTTFLAQFFPQAVVNETTSRALGAWEASENAPEGEKILAALRALNEPTLEGTTLNLVYAGLHAAKSAGARPRSVTALEARDPAVAARLAEERATSPVVEPGRAPAPETGLTPETQRYAEPAVRAEPVTEQPGVIRPETIAPDQVAENLRPIGPKPQPETVAPLVEPGTVRTEPRLLPGERQGDLISSTQSEPFALVREKGPDNARRQAQNEKAAQAREEALQRQESEQQQLSEFREHEARGGDEFIDALKAEGGLPALSSSRKTPFRGELQNIREELQNPNRKERIKYADIFRKDALGEDALTQRMQARGFNVETPGQLLEMVRERIRTGQPRFGNESRGATEFAEFLEFSGENSAQLLGVRPGNPFRAKALAQDMPKANVPKAADPNVEARWQGARLHEKTFITRARESLRTGLHSFRRHFIHLDPETDGAPMDILRRAEAIPRRAQYTAATTLRAVTDNLGPNKYEVFSRTLILRDLKKDIDRGLFDEKKLPFGYKDRTALEADLRKFESVAAKDTDVKSAIEKRQRVIHQVRDELVRRDLLPKEVKNYDDYFHRQVLEYYAMKDPVTSGAGRKDARVGTRGYQRQREGSSRDFNTSYIEAEFEVLSQAHSQIEMHKALQQLRATSDITPQLKAQAKARGDEAQWERLIPADHAKWQPERGNYFYEANTLADRAFEQYLKGQKVLSEADFRTAVALGSRKTEWVIPKRLATTLENLAPRRDNTVERFVASTISKWKQWTLLNPARVIRYNLNNMSGDVDIVMAYNPAILKRAPGAIKDTNAFRKGKVTAPDMRDMLRLDVIGSGFSVKEVPSLSDHQWFKVLKGQQPNLIERYWGKTKDFTQWREDTLRVAAYRHFLEKVSAGEKVYGASRKSEVDAVKDPKEKAAKLARELIGDYGNVSEAGQYIRAHILPFYSWMEINAPRYVRLMRNLPDEGRNPAAVGWGLATKTLAKGVTLPLKAATMYLAVNLWNRAFFADEEAELSDSQRNELHLILGRDFAGNVRSIRFEGALSDALSWFGGENLTQDIAEIRNGKSTVKEKIGDAMKAPLVKAANAALPLHKIILEPITGFSFYPDPFQPRPIRDRVEHAARALSVAGIYRWIADKPRPPVAHDVLSLLVYTTDPGEAAYFTTRSMAQKFLERQGVDKPTIEPQAKSNALYYHKQAIRYRDLRLADKYLEQYKAAGGTDRGLKQSIEKSEPLSGMKWNKKDYKPAFLESLSPEEQAIVQRAEEWYEKVYR